MKENEQGLNMYDAGRTFYENRISELSKQAEEVSDVYTALGIQDEIELAQLKLHQLNRREQVLEKNETRPA